MAAAALLLVPALACVGISPEPDPDALPSRVLAPPSAAYLDTVAEGRSIARSLMAEERLPGLSLAVAVDGEMVWAEGFGWADVEEERPVTPTTLFRIGGISETLTAAAAGRLMERGLLDLDAPVQDSLPGFPEQEGPVTLRQLMAHTAGIRPYRGEGGIYRGAHCADDAERLSIIAGEGLRTRPGTESRYATHGWSVVGAAVAAAAGKTYQEVMSGDVFGPLGMEHTFPEEPEQRRDETARFYYPRFMLDPRYGLHDAPKVDLSCHLPAVGLLSTPSDLVRFASAVMAGEYLAPATLAELQTPVRLASGEFTGRALGWTVASVPMGSDGAPMRIVGHGMGEVVRRRPLSADTVGGQVAGATALLLTVPEHGLAIAVTTNVSGAGNVAALAQRLADIFVRRLEEPRATPPGGRLTDNRRPGVSEGAREAPSPAASRR